MNGADPKIQVTVPESMLQKWQKIVDLTAKLVQVPAGLIMRVTDSDIEVFVSSRSEGNPYHVGDKEYLLGSGLYCETVLKTKSKLHVPNALADEQWKNNPDIKLNMISYLGFPILMPDGEPFGTICVLDSKENHYSSEYEHLMLEFRDLIQGHLELLSMNRELGDDNKRLRDYIAEIKALRSLLPICSSCRKIRDDQGQWESLEKHISKHTDSQFTHSICPDCARKLYPPDVIEGLF